MDENKDKIRIPPIYNEDYEEQWGKIDYNNKTVLDIGGSTGDTADYFLRNGAIQCINVDSNLDYINKCRESVKKFSLPILPIHMPVDTMDAWELFITMFKPDVVKSDCEGCEKSLFCITNEVFKTVKEYIIEVHTDRFYNLLVKKCKECGFKIKHVNTWTGEVRIVYIIKED